MIIINGHEVKPTIFPDDTSQVWHLPPNLISKNGLNEVKWWFESEAEVIHMCQLDYLISKYNPINRLLMPYFPYARQDKQPDNEYSFALYPFLDILRTWNYTSIHSFDVHFDFPPQLMPCENLKPPHLQKLCNQYDTLVFPDKGATQRYNWIKHPHIITGTKVRDQATGYITHFELDGEPDGHTLVVDDLCDGGATFVILAKSVVLMDYTLDLYVTHGIFSKGVNELLSWYDHIHTTNTYIKNKHRHPKLFIEQIC